MKRIIAAGVLGVIIAVCCIANTVYIKRSYGELTEDINLLKKEYSVSYESAAEKAEKFEEKWVKKEALLSIFANHGIVDEIGVSISKLPIYARFKSDDMFLSECRSIELELTHMLKDTQITTHSVF